MSQAIVKGPFNTRSFQIALYFQIPQNSTKHTLLSLHSGGSAYSIEFSLPNRLYIGGSSTYVEDMSCK